MVRQYIFMSSGRSCAISKTVSMPLTSALIDMCVNWRPLADRLHQKAVVLFLDYIAGYP